ncbi:hypothetical protein ACFY9F_27810 [Streptomyces sp. NPDC012421]|uniref:hypothetical protein n=1 Tax=Streptomyces sp. NPDC012421 TaxID=3364832 RepID=UPI0036EF4317
MTFLVLLVLLVLLPVVGIGFAGYGFGRLGRAGVRRADRETRLRCGAALAVAAAVGLYTWGLLLVGLAVLDTDDSGTDAFPARPCRVAGDPGAAADVVGHRVEYLPPRYVCELSGGGSRATDDGPGYVGPGVLVLAGVAAVCLVLAETGPAPSARKTSSG